jgi:pyrimidine deaminase RibD-like protein
VASKVLARGIFVSYEDTSMGAVSRVAAASSKAVSLTALDPAALDPAAERALALKAAFMEAALEESRRALPACRPNPPVGCVIVQGEQIVARGFTGPPGQPHAEAAALAQLAGSGLEGLSAYVTLEPCSFARRTPSCALALAAAGIRHVVVSLVDPHPRNQGRGLELLRAAGVVVEVGLLEAKVREFIAPYLIHWDDDEAARQATPTLKQPG